MKLWTLDHNQVLSDLKDDFEIVSSLEEADKVVLWNDVNPLERGIIQLSHSMGKKVIVMQHGRKGTSKYYSPFNEQITADKLLVWGEFDKESLIKAGQDPKKIEVVGTTIFSHLKPKKVHEGINIVFCPEHWDRPVEENIKVRDELRKLQKARKKIQPINIITKIIESHNPKDFDNPIVSNRDTKEHLDICAEVLSTADLVVGVSESTFELLAQAMDIPVVIMEEWEPKAFGGDMRYTNYRRIISEASSKTTLKDLNETILKELGREFWLREKRRKVAEQEGGIHLDSKKLIREAILNI